MSFYYDVDAEWWQTYKGMCGEFSKFRRKICGSLEDDAKILENKSNSNVGKMYSVTQELFPIIKLLYDVT